MNVIILMKTNTVIVSLVGLSYKPHEMNIIIIDLGLIINYNSENNVLIGSTVCPAKCSVLYPHSAIVMTNY
jgi:hypothetical protein